MAEKGLRFELRDLENQIAILRHEHPEIMEDEQLLADMLEGSTDLDVVIGKLVDQAREQKAQANAVSEMATALEKRAIMWEGREKATRALILRLMNFAQQRKITLPQATVSIANGRKSVVIIDESLLPESAWVVEKKVSKSKVKDLLEQGDVPGAAFSNGAETLTIR